MAHINTLRETVLNTIPEYNQLKNQLADKKENLTRCTDAFENVYNQAIVDKEIFVEELTRFKHEGRPEDRDRIFGLQRLVTVLQFNAATFAEHTKMILKDKAVMYDMRIQELKDENFRLLALLQNTVRTE